MSATHRRKYRVYVVKNVSTMKAAALKDFSPYVAKVKAQSAGDVNRVLPALKTMQQLKTIENNLILVYLKYINFNKTRYTVSGFI
jgi:peptidyl-prolyl cis-trans isomerase D